MDPVLGLGQLTSSSVAPTAQSLGSLDPNAFMNLMIAQLRYQDPLAPSDANAMMQQTTMLAQTELMTKLATAQQQLLGLQRATIAVDLVGTQVVGVAADGTTVDGVVDAVRFSTDGPLLVVGDAEIALEDATQLGGRPAAPGTTDPVDQPLTGGTTTDPVADPVTDQTSG